MSGQSYCSNTGNGAQNATREKTAGSTTEYTTQAGWNAGWITFGTQEAHDPSSRQSHGDARCSMTQ